MGVTGLMEQRPRGSTPRHRTHALHFSCICYESALSEISHRLAMMRGLRLSLCYSVVLSKKWQRCVGASS